MLRDAIQPRVACAASLSVGLMLVLTLSCSPQPEVEPATRHVILVSLDTLRRDALGCYDPQALSPNLDRFSADSVLFEEAISSAPSTKPSHASLFTGQSVPYHRVFGGTLEGLGEGAMTMADIFAAHGFRCVSFNGGGNVRADFGFDQGFENYESISGLEKSLNATEAWIAQNKSQPFFLFFHTYEAHAAYRPLDEDVERVEPSYAGKLPRRIDRDLLQGLNKGKLQADAADIQHIRRMYQAEVLKLDRGFGRLIDILKREGVYDDALIVLLSDHGEAFGEHGLFEHSRLLYDELLQVPLMFKLPQGNHAGERVAGMARGIDVLPTILEIANLPLPPSVEGESLMGSLSTGRVDDRVAVFLVGDDYAVRTGRWKLYRDQLFDLQHDPLETSDLKGQEVEVAEGLEAYLQAYLAAAPSEAGERVEPGDEALSELRALGYIE